MTNGQAHTKAAEYAQKAVGASAAMNNTCFYATEARTNTIEISIEEYTRLKDIEIRFAILKDEMIHASYCPIHHQIILGIEEAYAKKSQELETDLSPKALKQQEGDK